MVVETALGCNLRCPMCDQHRTGLTQVRRAMSPALRARLAGEALAGAARLGLTVSGEPFADPELAAWLALARRAGVRLAVATNGTVLPREDAELDAILGQCASVMVSLDSLDSATFARIRGRDLLPRLRTNLARMVVRRQALAPWRRPRLGISVVWMRDNLDHLGPILRLARDRGLDLVSVAHLTVHDPALDAQSLRHQPAAADAERARLLRLARALGVSLDLPPPFADGPPAVVSRRPRWSAGSPLRRLRHWAGLRRWRRSGGGAGGCPYLESRVYVSIDGLVSPCCMPGRPVLGDLRQTSLAGIWGGEAAQALRRALAEGRPTGACAHCSVHRQGAYRPGDPATVVPRLLAAKGQDPHPDVVLGDAP